jgi:hypothetical protein
MYAQNTNVSVERSRAEVEQILRRYDASDFFSGWSNDPPLSVIGFKIDGRMVKIQLPLPDRDDAMFCKTERGRLRTKDLAYKAWEQACRQKWRALCLVVKAKLVAVDAGISTVEREFLADVVLPNGTTFGQWAGPQMETIYTKGTMPRLLPGMKDTK